MSGSLLADVPTLFIYAAYVGLALSIIVAILGSTDKPGPTSIVVKFLNFTSRNWSDAASGVLKPSLKRGLRVLRIVGNGVALLVASSMLMSLFSLTWMLQTAYEMTDASARFAEIEEAIHPLTLIIQASFLLALFMFVCLVCNVWLVNRRAAQGGEKPEIVGKDLIPTILSWATILSLSFPAFAGSIFLFNGYVDVINAVSANGPTLAFAKAQYFLAPLHVFALGIPTVVITWFLVRLFPIMTRIDAVEIFMDLLHRFFGEIQQIAIAELRRTGAKKITVHIDNDIVPLLYMRALKTGREKAIQNISINFVVGVTLSFILTAAALNIGNERVEVSPPTALEIVQSENELTTAEADTLDKASIITGDEVNLTAQLLLFNALFDGLTLIVTVYAVRWALIAEHIGSRLWTAVAVDLSISFLFAYLSMYAGLYGSPNALSSEELFALLLGFKQDGSWSLVGQGPLFWVMHSSFLPTLIVWTVFIFFGVVASLFANFIARGFLKQLDDVTELEDASKMPNAWLYIAGLLFGFFTFSVTASATLSQLGA